MDLQDVGWGVELLASQEGLCSMELDSLFVCYVVIYLFMHMNSVSLLLSVIT
jgi:hypothetical protein